MDWMRAGRWVRWSLFFVARGIEGRCARCFGFVVEGGESLGEIMLRVGILLGLVFWRRCPGNIQALFGFLSLGPGVASIFSSRPWSALSPAGRAERDPPSVGSLPWHRKPPQTVQPRPLGSVQASTPSTLTSTSNARTYTARLIEVAAAQPLHTKAHSPPKPNRPVPRTSAHPPDGRHRRGGDAKTEGIAILAR